MKSFGEWLVAKKVGTLLACAFVGALILSGCVRIKRQSVTVKFEKGSTVLKMLFVYEGLHVEPTAGSKEDDIAKAKEELSKFVDSGSQVGLFLGGITDFNLAPDPADKKDATAFKKKLAALVDVHNDAFLLNEENKLSVCQTITVQDYDKLADVLNEAISGQIDAEMTKQLSKPPEEQTMNVIGDESRRKLQKAARTGYQWLKITYGKIELRFPMSPEDAQKFLDRVETNPSDKMLFRSVQESVKTLRVTRMEDTLVWSIGDGQDPIIEILSPRHPVSNPLGEEDLMAYARTLHLPFEQSKDTEAVRQSFATSR